MTDPDDPDNDEALLDRFRHWLRETRETAEAEPRDDAPEGDEDPEIGLYRLVEEFTALRQEVKTQAKSARGLQEETEALLPAFRQAIEQFRAVAPREEQAVLTAARPMAEALADLDEAIERGRVEIEKARDRLAAQAAATEAELDDHFRRQSWLRRRWHRTYHEEVRDLAARGTRETQPAFFDALLEGYDLIRARLRRALEAGQITRIAARGRPVDPERMTVVELVESHDVAPGHVVDEVRRGYTWRGQVLRFAEVRAARLPVPTANGLALTGSTPEKAT